MFEGFVWGTLLVLAFALSFVMRFYASAACYALFKFAVGLIGSLSAVASGFLWLISSHIGLAAVAGTPAADLSLKLNDWAAAGAFLSAICFMALWNADNFAEFRLNRGNQVTRRTPEAVSSAEPQRKGK